MIEDVGLHIVCSCDAKLKVEPALAPAMIGLTQVHNRPSSPDESQLPKADRKPSRDRPTKYTTTEQRRILELAGIEHVRGRTFEEADSMIDANIQTGRLPVDIRDRATPRQLARLGELGVECSEDISKDDATRLMHEQPTAKQLDFLRGLGAELPPDLTKQTASDLIDHYTSVSPMSDGQARFIAELGGTVVRSMTYKNAGLFIDYLLDHESKCSKCGARHDRRSSRCECGAFLPKKSLLYPPRELLRTVGRAKQRQGESSVISRFLHWIGLS